MKSGVFPHREANINKIQTNFSKVSETSAALVKLERFILDKGSSNTSMALSSKKRK